MQPGEVIPIFPTTITISNIDRSFTEHEMSYMLSYKDKVRDNGSNTKDIYILEQDMLANIKKLCEQALQDYLIQVYNPINPDDISLKITQSWLNFSRKVSFITVSYTHLTLPTKRIV